jgi:hypothetical protein
MWLVDIAVLFVRFTVEGEQILAPTPGADNVEDSRKMNHRADGRRRPTTLLVPARPRQNPHIRVKEYPVRTTLASSFEPIGRWSGLSLSVGSILLLVIRAGKKGQVEG